MSELEDSIRELKKNSDFNSYMIMNHDGIVIKHENMSLKTAVHLAYLLQGLCQKCYTVIKSLLDPADNELESVRLRTNEYEMIIAQQGNYTLVVTQLPRKHESKTTETQAEGEIEIKE